MKLREILLLIPFIVFAGWQGTFGFSGSSDQAYDVYPCSDGCFIALGQSDSVWGMYEREIDFLAVKVSATGEEEWLCEYSHSWDDRGMDIVETDDGGFLMVGSTSETVSNGLVIRTNSLGDTLWVRTYGGGDHDQINCIAKLDDGYALAGFKGKYMGYMSLVGGDFWLLKIDDDGETIWEHIYGVSGESTEEALALTQLPDGGFAMSGRYDYSDGWIIRTDSTGDSLWSRIIDTDNSIELNELITTSDSQIVVAGSYVYRLDFMSYLYSGIFLEFSPSGDSLGGATYLAEGDGTSCYITGICESDTGGFVVSGNTSLGASGNAPYIARLSSGFAPEWMHTYASGTASSFSDIERISDGYIMTGYANTGSMDVYMVRTNLNGTLEELSDPPYFTICPELSTVHLGDTMIALFRAEDPEDRELSYSFGAPCGCAMYGDSMLVFVPTTPGITSYSFSIWACNTSGQCDTCDFELRVLPRLNTAPYFTDCPADTSLELGTSMTFSFHAEDDEGDSLEYNIYGNGMPVTALNPAQPDTEYLLEAGCGMVDTEFWVIASDGLLSDTCIFRVNFPDGIDENKPVDLELKVVPNPFNSAVEIFVPKTSQVVIFDIEGRKVIDFGEVTTSVIWKPEGNSGIYFVRALGTAESQRLMYIK